ncbi:MAG TPA: class I SAM-dependent methyltransferase [Candidatus Methylomirabilis sp.]|nr:class I SAM-dependent methyltransferase [Candidatus Methylomirabilis sp.]
MTEQTDSLEQRYFEECLAQGRPYFGDLLRATQGSPVRHVYMQALVEAECRGREGQPFTVLEIGSWAGGSAITWADAIKRYNRGLGTVLCVDPWMPYLGEVCREGQGSRLQQVYADMEDALSSHEILHLFLHNIRASHCDDIVRVFKGKSTETLCFLAEERFDVVFVDGDHSYASALEDLRNSARLLRQGGILCGDDLELPLSQLDPERVRVQAREDYARDSRTGQYYHPGISLAVGEFFGEVSAREGFWAMRKRGEGWVGVEMAEIPSAASLIPAHLKMGAPLCLVEQGYKGYNILCYRGAYYAVAQALGPIDLPHLDANALADHQAAGKCMVGASLDGVRRRVDAQGYGGSPRLVEQGYRGFNILRYGDTYYALAQSMGAVDLTQIGTHTLQEYEARHLCVSGSSLLEVKTRMEAAERAPLRDQAIG